MPPSSGRTSTAPGPVKRGVRPSHRPLARWFHEKIHVIVDALGNPLALSLTGGNAHDITQAEPLAAQVQPDVLLADKGYDADSFINSLEIRTIKAVIPPRSTRKVKRPCDFALYAERNLVERFHTIKHYRAIATRYEKTARNFLAGLHLVCALAWLK